MWDLSCGLMDSTLSVVLVAALKVAGGAPESWQQLYLQSNELLDASVCAALSKPAVSLPALRKLHLNECHLGDAGAGAVANALCHRTWPVAELSDALVSTWR